ncbi:hypothetical protein Cflav_PD1307 [Pedosphaera parvula Ellin514]|uniref:Uncharacterized protein n=1 Tax=Pedosphaera parvula (strain Ellin514) TaxID=320771 RepID=B9XPX1_PEDPL|nr:hypothetical protein Cflav_PD1307 [Pedosphaera parvula Ellin514]
MEKNVAFRNAGSKFGFGKDGSWSVFRGSLAVNTCMGAMEIANTEFRIANVKSGRYRKVSEGIGRYRKVEKTAGRRPADIFWVFKRSKGDYLSRF